MKEKMFQQKASIQRTLLEDLTEFECGMFVAAGQFGRSVSEVIDLLVNLHTTIFKRWLKKEKTSIKQQLCG